MTGFFDFDGWAQWIHSLDATWLYLLILALVVAVVVRWSMSLRSDHSQDPKED